MKTAQADLTTGPLGKKIFRFSIPLIFSNLLQVLFNMADVAVVGRFAGSTALGAVGSTTIFVSLFTRSEERRVGKECRSRWSPYH